MEKKLEWCNGVVEGCDLDDCEDSDIINNKYSCENIQIPNNKYSKGMLVRIDINRFRGNLSFPFDVEGEVFMGSAKDASSSDEVFDHSK